MASKSPLEGYGGLDELSESFFSETNTLNYLIDHIFFPPRIDTSKPRECGVTTSQADLNLLSFVHKVASHPGFLANAAEPMKPIIKMLEVMSELQALRPGSNQLESGLLKAFERMRDGDLPILGYYVYAHNAGVIFRLDGPAIRFTSFEVSPSNAKVVAAKGPLECFYPVATVSIPSKRFFESNFLTKVAKHVSKFELMNHPKYSPSCRNSSECGQEYQYHIYDSVAPVYITEKLTQLLLTIGEDVHINGPGGLLVKRIADDVLFAGDQKQLVRVSSTTNVWRRSSIWLMVRVSLQICLSRSTTAGSHGAYKVLVLFVLAKLLEVAGKNKDLPSERLSHMSRRVTSRLAKLKANIRIRVDFQTYVASIVRLSMDVLQQRFEEVRAVNIRTLTPLSSIVGEIDIERDTRLPLKKSQEYIKEIIDEVEGHTCSVGVADAIDDYELSALVTIQRLDRDGFRVPISRSDVNDTSTIFRYAQNEPREFFLDSVYAETLCSNCVRDVQLWVETGLQDYVNTNSYCQDACRDLYKLLWSYTEASVHVGIDRGFERHRFNPISNSLKFLTTIELWVAIDRIATSIIPLLKEYPCEVYANLEPVLSALLLPTRAQMIRLHNINKYLQDRMSHVKYTSIFDEYKGDKPIVQSKSFSVRYFDQSPMHKDLLLQIVEGIEAKSRSEPANKRIELTEASLADFQALLEARAIVFELQPPVAFAVWRDATLRATQYSPSPLGIPDDSPMNRDRMFFPRTFSGDINISDTYHSKNSQLLVCFIKCPKVPEIVTVSHPGHARAITLGSHAFQCQYREIYMVRSRGAYFSQDCPTIQRSRVFHYDNMQGVRCHSTDFIHLPGLSLTDSRSFQIPCLDERCKGNREHSRAEQNAAICSRLYSGYMAHQYYALLGLRDTECFRLRWLYILRELGASNLCLNEDEVFFSFLQGAWQTGPLGKSNTYVREAHQMLHDVNVCDQLLTALLDILRMIKENPNLTRSMQLVIVLGARILALAEDDSIDGSNDVKTRAAYLLKLCRATCMSWLEKTSLRIKHMREVDYDNKERGKLEAQTSVFALVCRQTYIVEDYFAVIDSELDLGDFIECAFYIHLYEKTCNSYLDPDDKDFVKFLRERDADLAYKMQTHLRDIALKTNWFHSAIARIVPHYVSTGEWKPVDHPNANDQWITTCARTGESGRGGHIRVHYDLLRGILLVNAKTLTPLALPHEYSKLLKSFVLKKIDSELPQLNVTGTTMPDMEYQAAIPCKQYPKIMFCFGKRRRGLIVRVHVTFSTSGDAAVYEVIPTHLLEGDVPASMLTGVTILLDLTKRQLGFQGVAWGRSLSSFTNRDWPWVINLFKDDKDSWAARAGIISDPAGGSQRLIGVGSRTQAAVAEIFQSIVDNGKNDILLTFSTNDSRIRVVVGEHQLEFGFSLGTENEDTEILCHTFPGMMVDMRLGQGVGQDIGTLYGLKSYLVLRQADIPSSHALRKVIIPAGTVKYVVENHYTSVRIHNIRNYRLYTIDTLVGRLTTDDNFEDPLFKIYLHAVTSNCLPDPLTKLTGSQQALNDLRSAMVWNFLSDNFDELQSPDIKPLYDLCNLSPERHDLPLRHRRPSAVSSLTIFRWAPLPSFCQDGAFFNILKRLMLALETYNLAKMGKSLSINIRSALTRYESQHKINEELWDRVSRTEAVYRIPFADDQYSLTINNISACLERNLDLRGVVIEASPGFVDSESVSTGYEQLERHFLSGTKSVGPSTLADSENERPPDLKSLLNKVRQRFPPTRNTLHERYLEDLEKSREALSREPTPVSHESVDLTLLSDVESYMDLCKNSIEKIFDLIVEKFNLEPKGPLNAALQVEPRLLPCISSRLILMQLLRHDSFMNKPETIGFKKLLFSYGRAITQYQRATRMYSALQQGDHVQFRQEFGNRGHVGWNPLDFPEWLLFEIENNLLIRPKQAEIAIEMIKPQGYRHNTLLQLNMGEGKSSIIIPIVAATLADAQKFVRVVVLKPLFHQMREILSRRLRGLLNHKLYHVAFHREQKSRISAERLSQLREIFNTCMSQRGIFITQPEDILSFKLLGAEILCTINTDTFGNTPESSLADQLWEMQHWLVDHTRDVLDESDEVLHPKYELIYTLGTRKQLELGIQRWVTIQKVLDLVQKYVPELKKQYRLGIEVKESDRILGAFPFVRFVQEDAEVYLLRKVASEIITENPAYWTPTQSNYSISSNEAYNQVLDYVLGENMVGGSLGWIQNLSPLILLKGLLAIENGVLSFALGRRRYRVDYGLSPTSPSQLAIPYRAKDIPDPRAEIAHPDLRITLTYLCYYFNGLKWEELYKCFTKLEGLMNPEDEYHLWIHECKMSLPSLLRELDGVRFAIKDAQRALNTLYPFLRLNKRVIDYYLSKFVFPKECMEFSTKLSTSAWDLAEIRKHPTTGFSGTNDGRYLIPRSVTQYDLNNRLHTNAKVLSYLVQSENRFYKCLQSRDGTSLSGKNLLQAIANCRFRDPSNRGVQVIIDVGAQVLEMSNQEAALHWLSVAAAASPNPRWTKALFFNEEHRLTVIDQMRHARPFIPSLENMETCVVFLDEAHTRGTDIKLPKQSVAAVILGPNMTRDKLVQACMRMRNLGNGQSVRFFAPPEVHRKILKYPNDFNQHAEINIVDILSWAINETCIQIQKNMPLWASQGISYQTRQSVWKLNSKPSTTQFIAAWEEAASKSLTELYGTPGRESDSLMTILDHKLQDQRLRERSQELCEIQNQCREYGVESLPGTSFHAQQEIEILREIQVEHPNESRTQVEPHRHELHPSLVQFIKTGSMPEQKQGSPSSSPFCTLHDTLIGTSFGNEIDKDVWSCRILATVEFNLTVKGALSGRFPKELTMDLYLRPVHWIMSTGFMQSDNSLTLILLSPFEANELLPYIRESRFVNLHIYSAKNRLQSPSFNDLTFRAVPAILDRVEWREKYPESHDLMIQVGLYAGALFFDSYEEYCKACAVVGISLNPSASIPTRGSSQDLKIPLSSSRQQNETTWASHEIDVSEGWDDAGNANFPPARWKFLKHLVKARIEDGTHPINIEESHMGRLLQGKILHEGEWIRNPAI